MIRADPRLREELRLCLQMGIPHSRFLGWDELDQDKAIAYAAYEREACPNCGTRADEWDPKQGGDASAYEAAVHTCPGCNIRGGTERQIREGDESPGRYVVLIPRAVAEDRRRERDRLLAGLMAAGA
ncbi:hypothetical protein MXD62_19405 [Frankia sp. Mgl5]|uniref:hypothetical protein n=1 Tax=Frankia sp. Mgl5 TaxID=2933793 RepID=UPI00200F9F3A|nr:hypothetical protein [Frankia sp. Mgl5]MCK9929319.1 hypothetical protein [Frankia sp. Mgl5]